MALRNYVDERILAAARKLFLKNGFEETDMKAIAKEAEIAVGTIYNYYESKAALYERIISDNWEKTKEQLQIISQTIDQPDLRFKTLITTFYEFFEVQKQLMNELHNSSTEKCGKFKEMTEKHKAVRIILTDSLQGKQDAERLADTIISVIPRFVRTNSKEKQANLEFIFKLRDRM